MERHPRHLLPQKAGGGESAQLVDDSDNAKAAVFVEPNRPGSSLCTQGRTRLNKEERESWKEEKVGLTHSLRSGFLFPSSSPPHPPLPCYLFPTLTRKGYPSVCLDKPLKFSRENLQFLSLWEIRAEIWGGNKGTIPIEGPSFHSDKDHSVSF